MHEAVQSLLVFTYVDILDGSTPSGGIADTVCWLLNVKSGMSMQREQQSVCVCVES